MTYNSLISTDDLARHLSDPGWVLVDCRFELAQPDWGFAEYQKSHIAGAVYADLNKDLSSPKTATTGRHPLPDEQAFKRRLGALGIDGSKQVVVYDTAGGSYAARLWWLLRYFGHFEVAVLDGGFQKWVAEGRPVRSGVEKRPQAYFVGEPYYAMTVDAAQVEKLRHDPAYRLVDARGEPRFLGQQESIDPVAGHIPGAVNRFYGNNLNPDGTFLPPETLRQQFLDLLGPIPTDHAVVYCGSGVTSAHHLLAMLHAGLKPGRLYVGSWSEWITDPSRPIATGPEETH